MELGNIFFGNSRGFITVDRDLVNHQTWSDLVHKLIQVEDYHCSLSDYYIDYDDPNYLTKHRDNRLEATEHGGYICKNEKNEVIFELFPYWWGDCTCGADEYNEKLYLDLQNKIFTEEEINLMDSYGDPCAYDCPTWDSNETEDEKLVNICTCGTCKRNLELKQKILKFTNKIEAFEKEFDEQEKIHDKDCLTIKHNFIYHPGQSDEFWIDWYKYPFRDSYMNKNLTIEDIDKVFLDCQKYVKKDLARKK